MTEFVCPEYLDLCERDVEEIGDEFVNIAVNYLMAMGYLAGAHPALVGTVVMENMRAGMNMSWEAWDDIMVATADRLQERSHGTAV